MTAFRYWSSVVLRQARSQRASAANVFAAGGGIAGYDPTGIKARGGMAIATGYRAAQEAMAA